MWKIGQIVEQEVAIARSDEQIAFFLRYRPAGAALGSTNARRILTERFR